MKIKKRKEMRKRSYTQESKTELFFWLFLAKIIFLFLLRKCSSFSSSCKERWEACIRQHSADRGMYEVGEEEEEEEELNAGVTNERFAYFLFLA